MDFLPDIVRLHLSTIFQIRRVAWAMVGCGIALVIFAALGLATTASAQPPADLPGLPALQDTGGGRAIFEGMCIGCHTIGGGKQIGPDLKDVVGRRDSQWIKQFLKDPAKMLDTDPTAQQLLKEYNNVRMPNLGLSADQVDQLIAFFGNPGSQPFAPKAATGGDAATGHLLFTGEKPLTNDGPACMGCHSVGGIGSLGGGALGPDLTHVVQRLGESGLTGALKTIAFPTMIGPFQNRPLSEKEQADLIAFFKDRDRKQGVVPSASPGALTWNALVYLGIGLGIAVVFFIGMAIVWLQIRKRYAPRLPIRKL